jgi:HEXXH motif-containing protein
MGLFVGVEVELTLLDESEGTTCESLRWALAPSVPRVAAIDDAMRLRLADSLAYLAEVASLADTHSATLAGIANRLKSGPVSPWVFCLYSKLVSELARNPRGDVAGVFAFIAEAAALPADPGVVAFRDTAVPAPWWDHFRLLFDTDRQRPFRPKAPGAEAFATCKENIEAALAVLKRADPVWHEEVLSLVRMIALGAPGSADPADRFNGASTFFLWGASLLNADLKRSSLSMVDLLVHESSHVLLFGVSAEGALTENSGSERYDSPLRKDKRPIDGIFHACFVSTRVHLAMSLLLGSGALSDEEAKIALERGEFNGNAARTAIDELDRHARLTKLGENVLDTLRAYWAGDPAH